MKNTSISDKKWGQSLLIYPMATRKQTGRQVKIKNGESKYFYINSHDENNFLFYSIHFKCKLLYSTKLYSNILTRYLYEPHGITTKHIRCYVGMGKCRQYNKNSWGMG